MDKDKEKSAVDEFLGNLENKTEEGSFQDNTQDTFGETIEPKEVAEEKEEKPLPFNKDPKIQKFIEKELDKRMANFKPSESEKETKEENDEVVDALIAVIGNDTPEKRRAVQALRDRLDEGARKITEWENQQREAELADEQAEKELEDGFSSIEEQFEFTFTKEKKRQFAEFLEKVAPKDGNGEIIAYPDFLATYETFDKLSKVSQPANRAKELASRSMARSAETGSSQVRKANTSSFESTDNFLESLGR